MIANFFKKTKPIHAIFIGGIFVFFYLLSIFLIEKPEFSFLTVLLKFGFSIVFLILFFLIRFINRKNNLSGQDSYVLLSLAFLFGMFPKTMQLNDVFISHFLLLFAFRRTYSIQSLKSVKLKVFDSGFWIGIAALFYEWSSLFLILTIIAVIVYKKQEIRNSIIVLIGFITPWFLFYTYCLVSEKMELFSNQLLIEYSFTFDNYSSLNVLVPLLSMSAYGLIAMGLTRLKINSLTNDIRPSLNLLYGHIIIAVTVLLFAPNKTGSEFIFAFLPLAVFSANLLQLVTHQKVREVFVYLLVLVSLSAYIL
ncbi:MAG: hypothetical protein BM563_02950 [Bacteroidetes bacterium MedPE-SWsnd-G1]|nr:MAG: hypothetical protein BM563_02950 [Bacteroidetes bacterium MedPE-SWsnd-G1]